MDRRLIVSMALVGLVVGALAGPVSVHLALGADRELLGWVFGYGAPMGGVLGALSGAIAAATYGDRRHASERNRRVATAISALIPVAAGSAVLIFVGAAAAAPFLLVLTFVLTFVLVPRLAANPTTAP